jgi:hypothetical protein
MRVLLEPSWAVLEFELAAMLHCVIASYWARMQAAHVVRPTLQARVMLCSSLSCDVAHGLRM